MYTETNSIKECEEKRHSFFWDKESDILYIHTAAYNNETNLPTEYSRGVMQFENWSEQRKYL